jgi:hypothetical protein
MTTQQLTDDDFYSCGFLLGVVAKVRDCAKDGCPVCRAKMANGGSLPRGN